MSLTANGPLYAVRRPDGRWFLTRGTGVAPVDTAAPREPVPDPDDVSRVGTVSLSDLT